MSKTVKSLASLSTVGLAVLSVGAITLLWQNWDNLFGRKLELASERLDTQLVSNSNSVVAPQKTNQATDAQTVHGLKFKLLNCSATAISSEFKTIVCPYLVTSQQQGAQLQMQSGQYRSPGDVRLIDAQGYEYLASKIKLGADVNTYQVRKDLIKDIPLRGEVVFDNVPNSVQNIVLLELRGDLESQLYRGDLRVQFRKVSLSGV